MISNFYPPLQTDISYVKDVTQQRYHVGTRLEMSELREKIAQIKDRIFIGKVAYWSSIGACFAASAILVNPIVGTIALTVSALSFIIFRDIYLLRKAYSEQFSEVSAENLNIFVNSDSFLQVPFLLPTRFMGRSALKDQGEILKTNERRSKEVDNKVVLLTPINEERFIYERINCPDHELRYYRFNSFPSRNQLFEAASQTLENLH